MTDKDKKIHDLYDFFYQTSELIASEYRRIRKRATEDPGTAGDQGEENWATLLRDWLPATYSVVTKGRIISHEGKMSPQIDILVLKGSYPRKLLDRKIYLAAGVAAAFECKVTLTASHIDEAIDNCVKVKNLFQARTGSPYKELHAPIVYGLLAHSHSWKRKKSVPLKNIESVLIAEDRTQVDHPRKLLDLLCVADLATWSSSICTFFGPAQFQEWDKVMAPKFGSEGSATAGYIGHPLGDDNQVKNFTPIGALILFLSLKLAWEYPEYRSLADYYRLTNISGPGAGVIRTWEASIYSEKIRPRILKEKLSNGVRWDEWSFHFP